MLTNRGRQPLDEIGEAFRRLARNRNRGHDQRDRTEPGGSGKPEDGSNRENDAGHQHVRQVGRPPANAWPASRPAWGQRRNNRRNRCPV